jgi:integrase
MGEMAALRFSDFDMDERVLRVRRQHVGNGKLTPPKYGEGRRPRYIDLVPCVIDTIREWRERNKDELVVPGIRSRYIGGTYVRRTIANAGKAADLDLHSHDFRHTFGSWLLEAGCSVPYVAARMGHQRQAVLLDVYAHEIERADRRAPMLFEAWLRDDTGTAEKDEPQK